MLYFLLFLMIVFDESKVVLAETGALTEHHQSNEGFFLEKSFADLIHNLHHHYDMHQDQFCKSLHRSS